MFGNLVNGYPNTNFHEINLDYIIKLVRENNGLHLDASGNQLLLKTLDGTTVSTITVPYATNAGHADTATSANSATFATTATNATNAVNATNAGHALTADNATTAGTALVAQTATTAGTATEAVHATSADTATNATNAVNANNADYAETTGHVEHADKAIELVSISGDSIKFRTYDGTETVLTMPYAVKALKDSLGNEIKSTYICNVVDDNGTLKFKDAEGNDIVSLVPSVETASNDSYGNLIADMVRSIAVSSNSNYVTVTHGTGAVDTILINYSERAYKDTNDNVIKNTYIKSLAMVEDADTGHFNLVAYNGDNPSAEILRLEIIAYRAQTADEATHATNADNATNALTAQNAVSCNKSAYFIDCYDNNDNGYSIDDPNTITIEHVFDNAGNEVPLSSITSDDYHNVYFRLRASQNATEVYTYTADTSYKVGSPNSPVFFKARIIDNIDRTDGVDSITYENIEVGILNGTVITSKLFTYTEKMTSKIIQAEIKTTDTSPLNLTVGQSFDYETDIDASTFIWWVLQGNTVMVRFHDEDNSSQGCYLLQNGGPVIMFAYEMGAGPAYFQVTNNNTYTNGLKLIRM